MNGVPMVLVVLKVVMGGPPAVPSCSTPTAIQNTFTAEERGILTDVLRAERYQPALVAERPGVEFY